MSRQVTLKKPNCSTACVGDTVEVSVQVYWHGYVVPEFKRDVNIVDPYPDCFTLADQTTNIYDAEGYGGSCQFTYTLKIIEGKGACIELPQPKLCLDNVQIPIAGTGPTLKITSK